MKIDNRIYTKSLFDSHWTPAVEAPEDLAATTNDMMRRAGSARNADPGNFDPARTSDETRQQDGGNISDDTGSMSDDMGVLTPDNAPGGGGDDLGDMGGGDTGGDDLGLGDMGGGDDMGMGGGDDMGGSDMGGGMGGEDLPQETPEQAINIVSLQKKMSQFYQVLENTVDALSEYAAPASTPELQRIYSAAINHLTCAKENLRDLLVTDFLPSNYAFKLRKYVALRHVYSTVLEMLNLHFKILHQEIEAKNITFT